MSEIKRTTIYLSSLHYELLVTFNSSKTDALFLNSSPITIIRYVKSGKIFKKEYILSLKILDSP